jgi:hypothetical protein
MYCSCCGGNKQTVQIVQNTAMNSDTTNMTRVKQTPPPIATITPPAQPVYCPPPLPVPPPPQYYPPPVPVTPVVPAAALSMETASMNQWAHKQEASVDQWAHKQEASISPWAHNQSAEIKSASNAAAPPTANTLYEAEQIIKEIG